MCSHRVQGVQKSKQREDAGEEKQSAEADGVGRQPGWSRHGVLTSPRLEANQSVHSQVHLTINNSCDNGIKRNRSDSEDCFWAFSVAVEAEGTRRALISSEMRG